ncbi:low choriolytic enzyme-like, partial [Lycorma delicatula]|uniref:low choriolytic enzyme-like n=1 Tax=Lycorma delicatula TaxID=130591 RepID=UPI003F513A78
MALSEFHCTKATDRFAEQQEYDDEKDSDDLFEGDIIMLPKHISELRTINNLVNDEALWPNKTLLYDYAMNEFSHEQIQLIEEAIIDFKKYTCIKFKRRDSTTTTYIYFRNIPKIGCASPIGYYAVDGPLHLFLGGYKCQRTGTIQHELLHALGFWHEHTRYDRDKYVNIIWGNVARGREFNFYKKTSPDLTETMPYDYGSVMHYRSTAFSKDRLSPTIIPHENKAAINVIGQRIRFSNIDIAKLNLLYNCPSFYYRGDDVLKKSSIIGYLYLNLRDSL